MMLCIFGHDKALVHTVVLLVCLISIFCLSHAQELFVCDRGSLDETCFVSTPRIISTHAFIKGHSMVIANEGRLVCNFEQCSITIIMEDFVKIEDTGTVDVNVGKLNIETHTFQLLGSIFGGEISILADYEITLSKSGYVSATGRGNFDGKGLGAGISSPSVAGGGSYGGYSVIPGIAQKLYSTPYGDATHPVERGSGGGTCREDKGGYGGGTVFLSAGGSITLDGTLSVNGTEGHGCAGGGSGGSVYMSASAIEGTGTISANGGGSQYGGLGSGGRIAISLSDKPTQFSPFLTLEVFGGYNFPQGPLAIQNANLLLTKGAGTIYFSHNDTLIETQVDPASGDSIEESQENTPTGAHLLGLSPAETEWLSFPHILYWMLPFVLVLMVVVAVVVRLCSRRTGYQRIEDEYRAPDSRRSSMGQDGIPEDTSLLVEKYEALVKKLERCDAMLREIEEAENCIVCFAKRKSVALIPCGHIIYCQDCVDMSSPCPVCNSHVAKTFGPVYF